MVGHGHHDTRGKPVTENNLIKPCHTLEIYKINYGRGKRLQPCQLRTAGAYKSDPISENPRQLVTYTGLAKGSQEATLQTRHLRPTVAPCSDPRPNNWDIFCQSERRAPRGTGESTQGRQCKVLELGNSSPLPSALRRGGHDNAHRGRTQITAWAGGNP